MGGAIRWKLLGAQQLRAVPGWQLVRKQTLPNLRGPRGGPFPKSGLWKGMLFSQHLECQPSELLRRGSSRVIPGLLTLGN